MAALPWGGEILGGRIDGLGESPSWPVCSLDLCLCSAAAGQDKEDDSATGKTKRVGQRAREMGSIC